MGKKIKESGLSKGKLAEIVVGKDVLMLFIVLRLHNQLSCLGFSLQVVIFLVQQVVSSP